MQLIKFNINRALYLLLAGVALLQIACNKEEVYEKTRLFRPVLNEELMADGNSIIVNMGNIKEAVSYTLEVSRDTFKTIEYTFDSDTNYVVINSAFLNGESLLWNTLYQVRVTAHASDPAYDSKVSDLGSVRTDRFPSILNIPESYDVIDVAARVSWQVLGAPVTKIRTFSPSDLQLSSPLAEFDVDMDAQTNGEFIVTGLDPETAYQIAIYSDATGSTLRGWETYVTLEKGVDPTDPNVIDLSTSEDVDAVVNAVAGAADGQLILVKKGFQYNLPSDPLDKSITIRGAYGFGPQKAILFTPGNWNVADGATVGFIRFIDLELRGEDIGGDYVFNPNNSNETTINELTFDNCVIGNFRGIIRIRSKVFLKSYNINNCIVHDIGGYGIITTDTDGAGNAAVDDIALTNSTFSKINSFMTSRQNAQSILIDACTMSELASPDGIVFRWRGEDGVLSNVLNGITITNTVWGHAWDEGMTGNLAVRGIYDGLEATTFNIVNTYATSDFAFTAGSEIPGFPSLTYGGKTEDLWVDPYNGLDFNFKDSGFAGKYDTGDPRWRAKL
ncbi:MAG: DUF4957 domain-containing protein [Saprospiraceae bacterium]|nr:DUF4957 domain-containing protein [Saprospiraceae bacterium]MCB0576104.1 DUF4957 domain-containing protein [Saprospiraceae bacterium]MCB9354636.1 DUF4957 domain-containing protein [Lewinellaceae bacterium]